MNGEPIDLRLPRRPAADRPGRIYPARPIHALDEAFAATTGEPIRRDDGPAGETAPLADALRAQLRALETQRERLTRLLEGLA